MDNTDNLSLGAIAMENAKANELSEKADQIRHALSLVVDVIKRVNASATRLANVNDKLAARASLLGKVVIGVAVVQVVIAVVQLAIAVAS